MKSESRSPRTAAAGRRKGSVGMAHLPIEWMDPMSWRLPSGKALAEFALQTGFLAPLLMRAPKLAKKKPQAPGRTTLSRTTLSTTTLNRTTLNRTTLRTTMSSPATNSPLTREQVEEAPARTGSFR